MVGLESWGIVGEVLRSPTEKIFQMPWIVDLVLQTKRFLRAAHDDICVVE